MTRKPGRPHSVTLTDVEVDRLLVFLRKQWQKVDGTQRQQIQELCTRLEDAKRKSASEEEVLINAETLRLALRCLSGCFSWLRVLAEFLTDG